ncbi:MAG: hypothetical protein ACI86S_000975 [Paracoccaceae bacterium]|jgi:hypothetical protein
MHAAASRRVALFGKLTLGKMQRNGVLSRTADPYAKRKECPEPALGAKMYMAQHLSLSAQTGLSS